MPSTPLRLTPKETLVLKLLICGDGEQYGLQLVERAAGQLARGTVYVLLDRMQEKGLVESRQEDRRPGVSGIPRRMYRPTGLGVRAYHAAAQFAALTAVQPAPVFG